MGGASMQSVTYSDKLKRDRKLYRLAEHATGVLVNLLEKSRFAAAVSAEWDLSADERGKPLVTLRLRDDLSETSYSFVPWYLEDERITRSSLRVMWLDLLTVQGNVQHAKVEKLVAALDGD
jgi:hypothetical protein